MITVACVEHGNYLGRGEEYVSKLRAMVARNLRQPHRFECLRPNIGQGWWNKVALFEPARFKGRVLYLDLDCVITGPLDDLVERKGIIHLRDWGWTKNDYGSGVMVWDAGEHGEVWTRFSSDVPKRFRGDQDYMTALGGWDALPSPPMLSSYRYHCKDGVPEGCAVVSFHGAPKPHEVTSGWVPERWH